jgi:CHAT domain-containing protein/tetratricopeptide (TPR) repeat protein
MRRLIALLFFLYYTAISLIAQSYNPQSWDEIVSDVSRGNEAAVSYLVQNKSYYETLKVWNTEEKNNYIGIIGILVEYCSNHGFIQDEETMLKDAMKNFNEKDTVANSVYTRRLWLSMTKLQKDLGDADALLNYAHETLILFDAANCEDLDYVILLNNIALGYSMKKDWLSAKLYADEAADLFKNTLIPDGIPLDYGYYHILNQQGLIAEELGHYDDAEHYFKEVVTNATPDGLLSPYGLAINNLSVVYTKTGRYNDAISLLENMKNNSSELEIYQAQNLLGLYYIINNNKQATKYLQIYNNKRYSESVNIIQAFSETERESYLTNMSREMVLLNDMVALKFPVITSEAFDANLFTRSVSLSINTALHEHISNNENLLGKYNSLRQQSILKNQEAQICDSIKREIIDMEKRILRNDTTLIYDIAKSIGSWEDIKSHISKDEAIVLFCYAPVTQDFTNYKANYGAFICLPEKDSPILIKLCDVDEAEDIFYNNTPSIEYINQLYSETVSNSIYRMLWEPIMPYIKEKNKIYYSTVGPLSIVNMEALSMDGGIRLSDKYEMIMLSSPSEITQTKKATKLISNDIALFGAAEFDISVTDMSNNAKEYESFSGIDISDRLASRGEILRDGWISLPGTQQEILDIVKVLKGKNIDIKSYIGCNASEETIKSLSGNSPRILHIATHGFVISNQTQYDNSQYAQSVNGISEKNTYMTWTGLVFSGGNNAWKGFRIPNNVEDGILTADEISRLDLSSTQLVVLSACETARGHIDPVDGVWGLQRAFKQAGVSTILMTLWKIPDSTTSIFMEQFYQALVDGLSVRSAVKKAQKYLIYNGASDPFYWAPFVVLD